MNYIVSAFRFFKGFDNEEEARACFEEVKNDFTYCELKKARKMNGYYYAESLEIFMKKN